MARPRIYEERRVNTAFRIPVDLHARLSTTAAERDISVNRLVVKAIEVYLDNLGPLP